MYVFVDEPTELSNRLVTKSVVIAGGIEVVQMVVLSKLGGVFIIGGVTEELVAEANDYLTEGKSFCFTTVEG